MHVPVTPNRAAGLGRPRRVRTGGLLRARGRADLGAARRGVRRGGPGSGRHTARLRGQSCGTSGGAAGVGTPSPAAGARCPPLRETLRFAWGSALGEARGNAVLTARTAPGGSALSSREPCSSWGSVCLTVSVTRTRPCAAGSSALQMAPSVLRSVCHGPTRRQPRSDT